MGGYSRKTPRERISSPFLLLMLTLMLIIDIDRPVDGEINESQRAMEDLQKALRSTPTAFFDPPAAWAPGGPEA